MFRLNHIDSLLENVVCCPLPFVVCWVSILHDFCSLLISFSKLTTKISLADEELTSQFSFIEENCNLITKKDNISNKSLSLKIFAC